MWILNYILIVIAYLLGSIPFGYIVTRLSSGQNILEIGWQKTSGSNVFRNIGWWQGGLTGLLDLGKGSLAVYLSQYFHSPYYIQAFCGLAAVVGHNWSCFLRFSGGRGIGTFLGAALFLSPQRLVISLIPFAVVFLIWDAAIGTILFLATVIVLSFYPFSFLKEDVSESIRIFSLFSLFPIFLKRLSPISEIIKGKKKNFLFFNRLIFDDNKPHSELRIKRILKIPKGKY